MLKAAPKFGDNMVLQRNKRNLIWGTAPEQEVVEVCFLRHFYIAEVRDGKWEIELDPMDAGGPYTMDVYCKTEHLHFRNVMIGEVWLVCGKPDIINISFCHSQNVREKIHRGNAIHTYCLQLENDNPGGVWGTYPENSTEYENDFVYHFAKALYTELRVPIGMMIYHDVKCSMMQQISEKVVPYGLRGVLLYQSLEDLCETFSRERIDYQVIRQWRELFMNKMLDIYLMQMPMHFLDKSDNWCMLRQKPSLGSGKEGITVIMDCNEYDKKEYPDKSCSAGRIAEHVLGKTYGRRTDDKASYKGEIQIKSAEMEYYFAG
ncbi:MAG: hypothetical protein K2L07_01610 [Lachnospiraceae bacterium]|nr:hypothetical protein [Lachnospiraceae bacterium]